MSRRTLPRRSIDRTVVVRGPGLFSALQTVLTLHPAAPGTGIVFHRADLPGEPAIPATIDNVAQSRRQGNFGRCTVLSPAQGGQGAASIHTTEHLLSAVAALGITDLRCELSGAEVPMLDGSALGFADALRDRVIPIAGAIDALIIRHPVTIHDPNGGAVIHAEPGDGTPTMRIDYALDYGPGSPIPPHDATFTLDWSDPARAADYQSTIAPARTFCTQQEAGQFQAAGFFAHVAPGEVLILGHDGPVGSALRFPDEPARHKVLDVIGDLALVGRPIIGRISCTRSGHVLNAELARRLVINDAAGSFNS